jgi:DNA-binding transcriptional LysR family regulator
VRVNGRFRTDSTAAAHVAVEQGIGLGLAPLWQVRDLLDRRAVEVILAEYEGSRVPIHAVFPPGKMPSATTRLFVDLLADQLKREHL